MPNHRLRHTNKEKQMGEYKRHQGSEKIPETHRLPPMNKAKLDDVVGILVLGSSPGQQYDGCGLQSEAEQSSCHSNLQLRRCIWTEATSSSSPPVMTDPEMASEEDNQ